MNHKRQTAAAAMAMAAAAGKDARQGTRLSIKRVAKAEAGVGHGYWHRKQLLRRSSDQLVESI